MGILLAALGLGLGGCQRGPRNFLNENDRLRRENLELTQQVTRLEERVQNLQVALEIERRRDEAAAALPADVERPVVTRIRIGRFSGGIDTTRDGRDDSVRLYLETFDARGRVTQVIGEARVSVVYIPPGREAMTLATASFDAGELDAAYRSSFAGTHYTLVVPVPNLPPRGADQVTVRVSLRDRMTGQEHQAESSVRWSPGPAGEASP